MTGKVFHSCETRRGRRRGFTLMEVLLVLAILGVITSMVVPRLIGRQQHANVDATKLSLRGVEHALKLYALDHSGNFPPSTEGLNILLQAPGQRDPRWRGPYLEQPALDAWGSPVIYEFPGRHNTQGYDIVSAGPDKIPNTADDIGNWENAM